MTFLRSLYGMFNFNDVAVVSIKNICLEVVTLVKWCHRRKCIRSVYFTLKLLQRWAFLYFQKRVCRFHFNVLWKKTHSCSILGKCLQPFQTCLCSIYRYYNKLWVKRVSFLPPCPSLLFLMKNINFMFSLTFISSMFFLPMFLLSLVHIHFKNLEVLKFLWFEINCRSYEIQFSCIWKYCCIRYSALVSQLSNVH